MTSLKNYRKLLDRGYREPEVQLYRKLHDRLPYGFLSLPSKDVEMLFDRGYRVIAERPISDPVSARMCIAERRPDHLIGESSEEDQSGLYGWFNQGGQVAKDMPHLRRVLTDFILGLDVKRLLQSATER